MSSTSLERQPFELLPSDLLRPLGAFEELFCLFDQHFPTNGALAAKSPATQPSSSGAMRSTQ
jgi:hypothetical protein